MPDILNLLDLNQVTPPPVHSASNQTQGAALIELVHLPQEPLSRPLQIVSITFSAYLGIVIPGSLPTPFGRFSTIYTGILTQPPAQQLGYSPNGNHPMPPLPADSSLFTELWNPANDPIPPTSTTQFTSIQGLLPVSSAVIPAQAPEISSATDVDRLYVGIWMPPSLLYYDTNGFAPQRTINQAVATVAYDDSRPGPSQDTQGLL